MSLRPRSERCPEPECLNGGECWRCDYEESQAADAARYERAIAAPMPELDICVHCGVEVELKCEPNMGGPFRYWWVHDPGGYTLCDPQAGAASTRAQGPGRELT